MSIYEQKNSKQSITAKAPHDLHQDCNKVAGTYLQSNYIDTISARELSTRHQPHTMFSTPMGLRPNKYPLQILRIYIYIYIYILHT